MLGTMIDLLFFGFDTAVYKFIWWFQNGFTIAIANFCQYTGDSLGYTIYGVVSLLLCFPKKTRKYGAAMIVAFIVGLVSMEAVKFAVGRDRPYVTLQNTPFWDTYNAHWTKAGGFLENDPAFPSGHTSVNFLIFTALAAVLLKEKKKWAWALFIIPVIVGCSRIIRCVHYPSDVVAGMVIGIASGLVGYMVTRHFFYRKKEIKIADKIGTVAQLQS